MGVFTLECWLERCGFLFHLERPCVCRFGIQLLSVPIGKVLGNACVNFHLFCHQRNKALGGKVEAVSRLLVSPVKIVQVKV